MAVHSQVIQMVTDSIRIKRVPMIKGSPGVGKSQLIAQIAKSFNLKLLDIRLSQADPTDLAGYPVQVNGKMDFVPPAFFPLKDEPVPDGYNGWLIFFDEMNSANDAIQAASYKIILDRMVHLHELHPHVAIVAAGNLDTDNAIVNPLSTPMQSRLIHIELETSLSEWLTWAGKHGIDQRIIGFLQFRAELLHMFKPDHDDNTYPCPRTWEWVDDLLKLWDSPTITETQAEHIAGTVGTGAAAEFVAFTEIYINLPTLDQIIKDPKSTPTPSRSDMLYAVSSMIGAGADSGNLDKLIDYIARIDPEFQVFTIRDIVRRNVSMLNHKAIVRWKKEHGGDLF